jgi:hypothetical protein
MIIIPNNINNCISKVADHQGSLKKHNLYLGGVQSVESSLLREYNIKTILTVASGLNLTIPTGISHKIIEIEDSSFENISQFFSETN